MGKLATIYGLTKGTIQQLVTGKTWMSYQPRFASLFDQGAETYSDPTTTTQASGNPFLFDDDADDSEDSGRSPPARP
jgi:hypothetical protein